MSETLELNDLPKGHVSVSQIEMARRCMQQYYYRYIKGMKRPPSFAMVRGTAGHETMDTFFKVKQEENIDMRNDEFIDCYETQVDAQIDKYKDRFGEIDYTRKVYNKASKKWEKEHENPKKARGRTIDETVPSLNLYYKEKLTTLVPVGSEQEYEITLSTGLKIVMKIDFLGEKNIVEYKFSTRKLGNNRPTNQMMIYSIAVPEHALDMHRILPKGKWENIETGVANREAVGELIQDYENVSKMIRTGIAYRNPGFNDMNCNMCGYKDICRKVI